MAPNATNEAFCACVQYALQFRKMLRQQIMDTLE
jgi:hypothetical protein